MRLLRDKVVRRWNARLPRLTRNGVVVTPEVAWWSLVRSDAVEAIVQGSRRHMSRLEKLLGGGRVAAARGHLNALHAVSHPAGTED